MSDADLKAYSDAYDEKMQAANELAKNTYASDFDDVAKEYQTALKSAFSGLPKELETLGKQTMSGFIKGLQLNTDYLDSSVKTIIKGMISQIKKQLNIHSPSKVMEKLGDFTGQGYVSGLKNTVNSIKSAVKNISDRKSVV